MNLVHMTNEKRLLIKSLINEISQLNIKRQFLITAMIETERLIDEKQEIVNELMGLPISI